MRTCLGRVTVGAGGNPLLTAPGGLWGEHRNNAPPAPFISSTSLRYTTPMPDTPSPQLSALDDAADWPLDEIALLKEQLLQALAAPDADAKTIYEEVVQEVAAYVSACAQEIRRLHTLLVNTSTDPNTRRKSEKFLSDNKDATAPYLPSADVLFPVPVHPDHP